MAEVTNKTFPRVSVTRLAKHLLVLSAGICIILTATAECETLWWVAYLVAQFRVELFGISLLIAALLLLNPRPKGVIICAVCAFSCALLNLSHLLPYYIPQQTLPGSSGETIRLIQINLNVKNHHFQEVTSYIQKVDADVVLIAELTPEWQQYFSAHLKGYPHAIAVPRIDTYGIGVYSKSALKNGQIEYFGSSGHPSILAKLTLQDKPVSLLHTHVQGPVKEPFFLWHKEQFEAMAIAVNRLQKPLIMSGDMNSNTWTYLISDFLKKANLEDTQWGRGIHLTWPTPFYWRYGIFPLLAIDHFFVSKDVVVMKRNLGTPIGSDHYPVIIEVSVRR